MRKFDYVIAGAGAAGLTLAYLLMDTKGKEKKILLIDKSPKNQNDRTWCFWEKGDNLLEEIVCKRWSKAIIKGRAFCETYQLTPYAYKMIRGIDFYEFMKRKFSESKNITWVEEEVIRIEPNGFVTTDANEYKGDLVFDSRFDYRSLEKEPKSTTLLQHFLGWIIESDKPVWNKDVCTYMDFSVDQEGDCRFGYVLPFAENKALVEYTLFNQELLLEDQYQERLKKYISSLGVENYQIQEKEYGIIPMTDMNFVLKVSPNVINIGINGGFAKASTGYSFLRAQKILTKLVANLESQLDPVKNLPHQKSRFKKYDAALLGVLANKSLTGEDVFVNLFKKNGAHNIFKFLDEETSLSEELKIMSTTSIPHFGKSFVKSLVK